jgi:hypothetical protein
MRTSASHEACRAPRVVRCSWTVGCTPPPATRDHADGPDSRAPAFDPGGGRTAPLRRDWRCVRAVRTAGRPDRRPCGDREVTARRGARARCGRRRLRGPRRSRLCGGGCAPRLGLGADPSRLAGHPATARALWAPEVPGSVDRIAAWIAGAPIRRWQDAADADDRRLFHAIGRPVRDLRKMSSSHRRAFRWPSAACSRRTAGSSPPARWESWR